MLHCTKLQVGNWKLKRFIKKKTFKEKLKRSMENVTPPHRQRRHKYNKGRNLYIPKHTLHPNSYENQRNSITRSYMKATYSPCRRSTWFWLVRKHFYSGCLWEFYLQFSQNFPSKARLKHFPMDNHCKTICGPVRSECPSCRVLLFRLPLHGAKTQIFFDLWRCSMWTANWIS